MTEVVPLLDIETPCKVVLYFWLALARVGHEAGKGRGRLSLAGLDLRWVKGSGVPGTFFVSAQPSSDSRGWTVEG